LVDGTVFNNGNAKLYNTLFEVDVVPPSEIPAGKSLNVSRVAGIEKGLFFDVCAFVPADIDTALMIAPGRSALL